LAVFRVCNSEKTVALEEILASAVVADAKFLMSVIHFRKALGAQEEARSVVGGPVVEEEETDTTSGMVLNRITVGLGEEVLVVDDRLVEGDSAETEVPAK
jgi:hypothetical protein